MSAKGPGDSSVEIDGSVVRRRRRERLWTQQQLADAAGLTTRSIKSIERSGGVRRADTLRALAEALDLAPDELRVRARATPGVVGRDGDLARLEEMLAEVQAGRGCVLLIAGEAGAGKTTLVEHLVQEAQRRGAWPRMVRCGEDDGAAPYRPWVELLRASAADVEPESMRRALGPGWEDVAQLVPGLFEIRSDAPVSSERHRLFDAVLRWWKASAERAAQILVVDDLHAADRSTLQLWRFVAEDLRSLPVLLVGTYRHTEVDRAHPLWRIVEQLDRVPGYDRIELCGLGPEHVAELAAATLSQPVDPDFSTALHARTAGNPFFVRELLRHLEPAGRYTAAHVPLDLPPRVHDAVRARVARLGDDVRELLERAAVIGQAFDLDLMRAVWVCGGAELADCLERAAWAGVLREAPGAMERYEFAHAILRDALYGQIPSKRRGETHRRVAEALEARPASDAVASERAHHWVRAGSAGDPERAYRSVVAAAREAGRRFAYDEAASYWQTAVELASGLGRSPEDVCRLLLERARALDCAGDAVSATRELYEVVRRARGLGSAGLLAEASLGLGQRFGQLMEFGHFDPKQCALLREALACVPVTPSATRAQLLASLSTSLYWGEGPQPSLELSREAVAVARQVGDPINLVMALCAEYMALACVQAPGRAAVLAEASEQLARVEHAEAALLIETLRVVEVMRSAERPYDAALVQHRMHAERVGQVQGLWWASALRAGTLLLQGRMQEGALEIERTRQLGSRSGSGNVDNTHRAQCSIRFLQERNWPMRVKLAREGVERHPLMQAWKSSVVHALAHLADREAALPYLWELASDDFASIRKPGLWDVSAAELAEACYLLGTKREAEILYPQLLPHAGSNVVLGMGIGHFGPMSRYVGLLDLLFERYEDSERNLLHSLERAQALGAHPWTAITLLDLAELRVRMGRHDLARQHGEEAERCARAAGLEALAQEARAVAQRSCS